MEFVRAIQKIAAEAGGLTIAEGVETRDELAVIKDLKINFAQGYLFGRPLPQFQKVLADDISSVAKKGIVTTEEIERYALLKNEKDLNKEQKDKLAEVKVVSQSLKLMHQLKEEFREIFEKPQQWSEALLELGEWLSTAQKYFVNSQSTIVRWFDEILAYFDNRTTSGVVEGINNKLKLIKRSAYGFTNFENFRNRCLLNWHFNC